MRPVSDALTAAVRGSHRMAVRVRVVAPGQTGTNPTGAEIVASDGDVQYDATADIRGTLDLTTDGTGWDPRPGRHLIQPYGNELFVERGVQVSASSIEWVSQGYYRIYSVEQQTAPNGDLRVAGRDRMSAIVDAKLTAPKQFTADRSASSVITELVTEVLPDAQIDWRAEDRTIGRAQVTEDDRFGFCNDIVAGIGAVWYWDYRGMLVVTPVADPATQQPVFTVDSGAGGVLVTASRSISRDGVFNAVVASAEGADDKAPARAIAYDDDPNSPTYWHGDYGQVPEFYSSPTITNSGQAATAARAMLLRATGLPYNVDLQAVPHPGLETNDVIRVEYPGFYEAHVIDKLTIPLTTTAMSATTRAQTTTGIGVG